MKRSITHDRAPNYIWYADKLISQGGVPVKITIQAFMLLYEIKMGCTFEYTETLWFNDEPENSPSGQYKCECPLIDEVKKLLASPLVDNIVICYVNDAVGFVACARQAIPAFSMLAIYAGDIVNKNQKD